jgi:hypothetical protein
MSDGTFRVAIGKALLVRANSAAETEKYDTSAESDQLGDARE